MNQVFVISFFVENNVVHLVLNVFLSLCGDMTSIDELLNLTGRYNFFVCVLNIT
jgi:hypothetical protein